MKKKFGETVNIITRTSNRENFFKVCHESVLAQDYPNIVHWVTYDDDASLSYLEGLNVRAIKIDPEWLQQELASDIASPGTGPRAPYNLYFNKVLPMIHEGWVMMLDDDDRLETDAISTIVRHIIYKNDLIVYQMKYANGRVLPSANSYNKKPVLGGIGTPCVFFNHIVARNLKWDGWKCGDYRFITKLWSVTSNKIWIKKPLVLLGTSTGNFGMKNDLPKEKATPILQQIAHRKLREPQQPPQSRLGRSSTKVSVLSCGWNCEAYIWDFLSSMVKQFQRMSDVVVYVMDDASSDMTHSRLRGFAHKNPWLRVFRSEFNRGAAHSRWVLMRKILEERPDSIVFQIDLDDHVTPDALFEVTQRYTATTKASLGNYRQNGKSVPLEVYPASTLDNKRYQDHTHFMAPPLRTFRASLIAGLKEDMFKDEKGYWLKHCTDVALMLGILVQCNGSEVIKISQPHYIYRNRTDKKGTINKYGTQKKKMFRAILKNFEKYARDFGDNVYVEETREDRTDSKDA